MFSPSGFWPYYRLLGPTALSRFLLARFLNVRTGVAEVLLPTIATPVLLRTGTSDFASLKQIFGEKQYLIDLERPPRWIIDAGAYIGLSAVFLANRYPGARILAVEPDAANFAMLRRNCGPYANIIPIHAALWSGNGRVSVRPSRSGAWGSTTFEETSGALASVEALTVVELLERNDVDFVDILKLDVEGAEVEILSTSDLWIHRTAVVMAELHDRKRSGCSAAFLRATAPLERRWRQGELQVAARRGSLGDSPC